MNAKIISGLVLLLVVGAGVFGFVRLRGTGSNESYTGQTEKVTIGVEVGILTAPILVAQEKGYFKEQGLDVQIKPYQAGKLALEAMFSGEPLDMVTVGPVPIALKALGRDDFSILTTFVYSESDDKIVARKDKGITTGSDLKGKRIGVTLGTSGQFFLSNYLILNGLSAADVHMVDLKPDDLPEAFLSGEVDAMSTWEPRAYNTASAIGDGAVKLVNPGIFRETFNMVAMKAYTEGHAEVIKRFIRALDKANTFIKEHPEESHAIVAQASGVKVETVDAVSGAFVYQLSLDQSLLLTLEDIARWAIQNKLTAASTVPNFLDFVNLDALSAVKPETVTITR